MPNKSANANVICPYYASETSRSITCEGLIDGTAARSQFTSAERKQRHMETCCYSYQYAKRCWKAAALEEKNTEE